MEEKVEEEEEEVEEEDDEVKPVNFYLSNLNSKNENDRLGSVKGLLAHLERGTDEGKRDEILLMLELACSDTSPRIRELALKGLKKF